MRTYGGNKIIALMMRLASKEFFIVCKWLHEANFLAERYLSNLLADWYWEAIKPCYGEGATNIKISNHGCVYSYMFSFHIALLFGVSLLKIKINWISKNKEQIKRDQVIPLPTNNRKRHRSYMRNRVIVHEKGNVSFIFVAMVI